ncbi:MAG: hypothetical protein ACRDZ3_17925 [Acidimicrobiia bacterium]
MFGFREQVLVLLALLPFPVLALAVAELGTGPAEPTATPAATATAPAVAEPVLRQEFLDAYEESRRATWLITYDFTRRLLNGSNLDLDVTELNRPPDHLIAGLGGLQGRIGGREVTCEVVESETRCGPEGPAVSFETVLADQLSELADVLQPPAKWYAVEAGGDRDVAGEAARCFTLRRVAAVFSPPYGERAEFCFAASDGAPLLNRIERREGTDQRQAIEVSRQVSDADLAALLG